MRFIVKKVMNIMLQQIVFYVFSAMAIISAVMVILSKNPIQAALSLVVTFIASAALWILLQAEFLGLILVLVYVGAVMTLFLFVIMMLNLDGVTLRSSFVRHLPFVCIILALMLACIIITMLKVPSLQTLSPLKHGVHYSNVTAIGLVLYTHYAYPFVLAGALLLVAIIAAISLTFRGANRSKKQRIQSQIAADPKKRVYLTKMTSEKKS